MRLIRLRAFVVVALVAAAGAVPARATTSARRDAAATGAQWIASQQRPSGAFFTEDQPADATAEALAALASGSATQPRQLGLRYLADKGPARARERAAYAARIVLGLVASGVNPRLFAGTDYVAIIQKAARPTGGYDDGIYADALAVLGLAAGAAEVPQKAVTYLRAQQCPDGGFAHEPGCVGGADTDTTGMTLMALVRAGVPLDDAAVSRARAWLIGARNAAGGFGIAAAGETNANSTGLALSAIATLGEDAEAAPWTSNERDPIHALLGLQLPDGSFRYSRTRSTGDPYATVQATPGIAGAAYPVLPAGHRSSGTRRETPQAELRQEPSSVRPAPAESLRFEAVPPARILPSGTPSRALPLGAAQTQTHRSGWLILLALVFLASSATATVLRTRTLRAFSSEIQDVA